MRSPCALVLFVNQPASLPDEACAVGDTQKSVTATGSACKEHVMASTTTILHPTDFSAHADHAFALACSLARASGSRLLVIHVASLPELYSKTSYREEVHESL